MAKESNNSIQYGLIDHNLATVTGSKSYSAEGFGVEKAFDGLCDDNNRWASNVKNEAELNFAFEQNVKFNRIKITEMYKQGYGNRLEGVEIFVSDNGSDYTSVQKFMGLKDNGPSRSPFMNNKSESTVEDLKLDTPVESQYVKLVFYSQNSEVNINEVQFFNDYNVKDSSVMKKLKSAMQIDLTNCNPNDVKEYLETIQILRSKIASDSITESESLQYENQLDCLITKMNQSTLGTNLALNSKVTAEDVYSENGQVFNDYNGSKTVDGNMSTRWATNKGTGPFEIVLDLEEEKSFNQLILYETDEYKGRLGGIQVLISNDQTEWNLWQEENNVTHSISSLASDLVTARYVKVILTPKDNIDLGMNVSEIKIFESEDATSLQYNNHFSSQKRAIDPNWIKPVPSQEASINQLRKQEMKYGMFIHYGVNTFTDNYWGFGNEDPTIFNPDPATYNPEDWVKTAWESGMNYVVLITKHHDGFSLFDTKYSDYKVTNNGHEDTNFDVVKATSDACKKYGIKLGLYYSIWDQNWDNTHPLENYIDQTERDEDYANFAYNQIEELMTNYGEVCELWIDGGWEKESSRWGYERIYDMVKRTNPNCQMSVNLTLGNAPIAGLKGGEQIVNASSDFRLYDGQDTNPDYDPKVFKYKGEDYYLPFEGTFIIGNEWFWNSNSQKGNMRESDPQKIVDWYNKYVKQENTLVVNVPPSNKGIQTDHEKEFIKDAAQRLGIARGSARKDIPENECEVEIRYVTTDGAIAGSTEFVYGKEGESYTAPENEKLKELGYELVAMPKNVKGKFTKDRITVEYIYKDTLIHPTDSNALAEKVTEAKNIVTNNYTEESVANLQTAITKAEEILATPSATQKDLNDALINLQTAIDKLNLKKANYSKVDAAIAKAEKLDPKKYEDFSKVEAAIQAVIKDKDITEQDVVDNYATAIEKAIAELKEKPVIVEVNKNALKEAIAKKPAK